MRKFPGVSIRKAVLGGDPCIAGTRIPTSLIHKVFMAGLSIKEIAHYFVRRLTPFQVETAIRYEMRRQFTAANESDGGLDAASHTKGPAT